MQYCSLHHYNIKTFQVLSHQKLCHQALEGHLMLATTVCQVEELASYQKKVFELHLIQSNFCILLPFQKFYRQTSNRKLVYACLLPFIFENLSQDAFTGRVALFYSSSLV
jgi:hypothetical protein